MQMVYADPPFNTGRTQARRRSPPSPPRTATAPASAAAATRPRCCSESSYRDSFDDYLGFLEPRLHELRRVLAPEGTLYLHLDYREAHYAKLLLDEMFGRECFLNELIWAYDYGAKPRTPLAAEARHDPRLRARPRRATASTPRRSTASRTWRPGSSRPSSASAASGRPA